MWTEGVDLAPEGGVGRFAGWALRLPADGALMIDEEDVGIVGCGVVSEVAPLRFVVGQGKKVGPTAVGDGGFDTVFDKATEKTRDGGEHRHLVVEDGGRVVEIGGELFAPVSDGAARALGEAKDKDADFAVQRIGEIDSGVGECDAVYRRDVRNCVWYSWGRKTDEQQRQS